MILTGLTGQADTSDVGCYVASYKKVFLILYKMTVLCIIRNTFSKAQAMATRNQEVPLVAAAARDLGQALRMQRQELGVTATAAAASARMSRVTWHRLEKGEPTVALGAWLGAAEVLGLEFRLQPRGGAGGRPAGDDAQAGLPLRIRLSDYPQLRRLAWQLDGGQALSPREALGIYERNLRHLQPELIEPHERALIDALGQVFGVEGLRV
jgi:hypothetical protein